MFLFQGFSNMWTNAANRLISLQGRFSPQVTSVRHSKVSKRRKDEQRLRAPHLTFDNIERKPSDLALAYFDDHYAKSFPERWPSIRLGLLSKSKPCALVNNFANKSQVEQNLRKLGCQSLKDDLPKGIDDPNYWEEVPRAVFDQFGEESRPEPRYIDDSIDEASYQERSMPKDEETLRGRIVKPEEQILGEGGSTSLQEFVPTKKLIGMEDFVEESAFYESYDKIDSVPVKQVEIEKLTVPRALNAFYFPRHVLDVFPHPKR